MRFSYLQVGCSEVKEAGPKDPGVLQLRGAKHDGKGSNVNRSQKLDSHLLWHYQRNHSDPNPMGLFLNWVQRSNHLAERGGAAGNQPPEADVPFELFHS